MPVLHDIIDLHAHYPMHLIHQDTRERLLGVRGKPLPDKVRAIILRLANLVGNYDRGQPVVTIPALSAGRVPIALSVLTCPFDEMDLSKTANASPDNAYWTHLLAQMDLVEANIRNNHATTAVIAHNHNEVDQASRDGKIALIHAVEGGFHFGDSASVINANVATAAARGVAYITVAHLFFRQVATNAPALPFLPDWLYRRLFPQPDVGLTSLGEALIRAMLANNILIDVTHMSARALAETFHILDCEDVGRTVPVVASHAACRFGDLEYNLTDDDIAAVGQRGGVIGLIACRHYMAKDTPWKKPKSLEESVEIVVHHIERIKQVTRGYDNVAIGTDFDGFIKPTLPGLEGPTTLPDLVRALSQRYPAQIVEKICSLNARRVLDYWQGAPATFQRR